MRPDIDTPARRLTRRECRIHALLAELARDGRLAEAAACRLALLRLADERAVVARVESGHGVLG